MKIFNCICCCCSCGYWSSACCDWLCVLTVWGTALKQLDKRSGLKLILALLCFCCTPFLCCTGCANCLMSMGSLWQKIKSFCDTSDGVEGFHQLMIPENPGPGIQKCFGFFENCCKA